MDRKQLLGIACLVCVVFIWNFSSYLVKTVYSKFKGPFFLTFFGNSLFALYLPGLFIFRRYFRTQIINEAPNYSMLKENDKGTANDHKSMPPHSWKTSFESLKSRKFFYASLVITPLWFIANFFYNLSLLETSVSSSTMISGTSCIFTYCLAYYWKREEFSWAKVVSIILTVLGMALVVYSDSDEKYNRGTCTYNGLSNTTGSSGSDNNNNNNTNNSTSDVPPSLLGDLFALIGAIFYGLYIVNIDSKLENNSSFEDLALFLGYVGFVGCICCLPIVFMLSLSGVENLSDLSFSTLAMIFCKGLFDNVLSDLLWAKAVILTSPTVSTIGINMTIPLSVISDWICGKTLLFAHYLGAISMTSGFILINLKKREINDTTTTNVAAIDDDHDNTYDRNQIVSSSNALQTEENIVTEL